MSVDQWRPDWTDARNYPSLESATAEQWAWEFLRRNHEYQTVFNEYSQFFQAGKFRSWMSNLVWSFDNLRNYTELCQKFKVMHLVDPAKNYAEAIKEENELPALSFRIDFGWLLPYSTQMETEGRPGGIYCKNFVPPLPEKWGEVLVKFDLAVPLSIQIEQLKNSLAEMQQTMFDEGLIANFKWDDIDNNPLNNPTELQYCLRALDASASNKTVEEIASGLSLNGKNASQVLDKAGALCMTDYYRLVVYSNNIAGDAA